MDFVNHTLLSLARWLGPYTRQIALAVIATLLALYGNEINRSFTKRIKTHNILLRFGLYVALCAFGYGAATIFLADGLAWVLRELDSRLLGPVVIGLFLAIGLLAERKGHI